MPINHDEIIEELKGQIRKCGGGWEEWCVGTAKDQSSVISFQSPVMALTEN